MKDSFDSWLGELAQEPVTPACSIDNPECDSCGS